MNLSYSILGDRFLENGGRFFLQNGCRFSEREQFFSEPATVANTVQHNPNCNNHNTTGILTPHTTTRQHTHTRHSLAISSYSILKVARLASVRRPLPPQLACRFVGAGSSVADSAAVMTTKKVANEKRWAMERQQLEKSFIEGHLPWYITLQEERKYCWLCNRFFAEGHIRSEKHLEREQSYSPEEQKTVQEDNINLWLGAPPKEPPPPLPHPPTPPPLPAASTAASSVAPPPPTPPPLPPLLWLSAPPAEQKTVQEENIKAASASVASVAPIAAAGSSVAGSAAVAGARRWNRRRSSETHRPLDVLPGISEEVKGGPQRWMSKHDDELHDV